MKIITLDDLLGKPLPFAIIEEPISDGKKKRDEDKKEKEAEEEKKVGMQKIVSWFSAGVSSAVATKLMIDKIDHIFYIHIKDQHPDTLRFVEDCEEWFEKPIEIMQSQYQSVEDACIASKYINGVHGASCTRLLKKKVRNDWEKQQTMPLIYIWGLDITEKNRMERLEKAMPFQEHIFPLIDRKITKDYAHQLLKASGIKRPAMYELGYNNNNCIGCVKGGKGYWNKIRRDFPAVFEMRAKMERLLGHTCINGVYLDELPADDGNCPHPVIDDCGIFCELMAEEYEVERRDKCPKK